MGHSDGRPRPPVRAGRGGPDRGSAACAATSASDGARGCRTRSSAPDVLTAVADVEVVIDAVHPATVRVPDVVVVPTRVAERNPPRLDAADVLLAVEIISPGA